MPFHDWTRVEPGIFHDFHLAWIGELRRALNSGLLPPFPAVEKLLWITLTASTVPSCVPKVKGPYQGRFGSSLSR